MKISWWIGGGMSALSEQPAFTRLRDFGAFQPDISRLPTNKMAAVQPESAPISASARLSGQYHITNKSPAISIADPIIVIDGPIVEGIAAASAGAMPDSAIAVSDAAITGATPVIAGTGNLAVARPDADRAVVVTRLRGPLFDEAA